MRILCRSTVLVWATWRKDVVGLARRIHSINGADNSVLSLSISAMILSSSPRSRRAKCLFNCDPSGLPSSSIKGFAVVTCKPGIALSFAFGRLVRNEGMGIWRERSIAGFEPRWTVAIPFPEIAVYTSLTALASVDFIKIWLHSQLIGLP